MKLIVLKKRLSCSGCLTVTRAQLFALALAAFVLLPGGFLAAGYHLGRSSPDTVDPDAVHAALSAELEAQRRTVLDATRSAQENLDALATRLGQMQAHVIRLDALGQRLTKMADLDNGEFDFENPPAQGGPEPGISAQSIEVGDFLKALDELQSQLEDRERQLSVLESMLMNRNLQAEVLPAGRPIDTGWLSSYYGMRTDPFNGRRVHHSGVDFAGKEGSDVVAVAAGVVTWSGKRYGYGNLVEITHGNGYATRYGHNKENLVKVGDTVKKGQVIARMGSTGRSTGPHVHFEVLYQGKAVNPRKYIQAAN